MQFDFKLHSLCKFQTNNLSLMSLEPPKTASKDAADDATLSIKMRLYHNECSVS